MPPKNIWPDHADKLSGCWKCISYEIISADGNTVLRKPHGDKPLGRASLSPGGYLSAHMSVPALITAFNEAGEQWASSSDGEIAKIAHGLAMYCGQLELYHDEAVNADSGLWWATRVDISANPNSIGGLQKRKVNYFAEDGKEYMVLQPFADENTRTADGGKGSKAVLKWEKFE